MEIRFGEGLVAGIGEMMIALRKCALDAGESARETQAVRLEAEKMRELLRARRESAEHMVASCREKLVSVNNILEYENDRTEYWRGIKERIEKFLTIANEYMPVTEKACAFPFPPMKPKPHAKSSWALIPTPPLSSVHSMRSRRSTCCS